MDKMESRTGEARISILESLKLVQEVFRARPDPYMYLLQIVMESKADELVSIFADAFPEEKSRVIQILNEIDPGNKTKYEKITAAK
jgi:hypothetical protein